jgi:hypothetical protein
MISFLLRLQEKHVQIKVPFYTQSRPARVKITECGIFALALRNLRLFPAEKQTFELCMAYMWENLAFLDRN